MTARTNGFKIRPLNADCDRLAVQSSEQTTWLLGYKRFGLQKAQDVAIQQNELIVLRPYGGCPAFEIEPTGDKAGLLIVHRARGSCRSVRVGMKYRVELGHDESCTIRCEWIVYPHTEVGRMGTPGGSHAI